MNNQIFVKMKKWIPETYVKQSNDARNSYSSELTELMEKRRCPEEGWSEDMIELLLRELSMMDSNNFRHNIGVGEREARIYAGIVSRRHYGFGHGIGRSGDLTEVQPKATGSSLIYKLTNSLVLHVLKESGIRSFKECIVVPMATGMTLTLCLLALKKKRENARYVLWPRIDQKSCFKSITAAGFEPIIIENLIEGDELRTNVREIKDRIEVLGSENVVAVMTTTSCFAPRGMDKVVDVAKVCQDMNVPHIINNAYGLQSTKCTHHIDQATRLGRVDAVVQSTDKNFMVPVGGAVIAGCDKNFIKELSKTYPGRASSSPIIDLFVTLLCMGIKEYKHLLSQRKLLKNYMETELTNLASVFGLRVLKTPNNPISIAMTLPEEYENVTELGSKLFVRGVSGTRVLDGVESKSIDGFVFKGWGTHTNDHRAPYLTAAASIGMTERHVDVFVDRLRKILSKVTTSKSLKVSRGPSLTDSCEEPNSAISMNEGSEESHNQASVKEAKAPTTFPTFDNEASLHVEGRNINGDAFESNVFHEPVSKDFSSS